MNTVVFEHVQVRDLPQAWQAKLGDLLNAGFSKVTVRIEEDPTESPDAQFANDPLFGMWRDREDMADVDAYIRAIRAPRFGEVDRATPGAATTNPEN
ncbi:MAG: hypothetical protein IPO19_18995 [Rhodoferax sp.]|nr:hypothetical protein [Rhodoferax sp.]